MLNKAKHKTKLTQKKVKQNTQEMQTKARR